MNGLTNISNKILQDATQKADAIIAEAQETAANLLAEAKKRAGAEAAAVLKSSESRCADLREKGRLAVELEGRRIISNARQEMITQAFDTALERLLALPEAEYLQLLIKLANGVLADGKGGEVLLNARDRADYGQALIEALSNRATLADDSAPIVGGLIIRRGKIEYNCALDVLVRLVSEKIAPEVSLALFPEGA